MNQGKAFAGAVSGTSRSTTQARPMRILVRNSRTGMYFQHPNQWTSSRLEAASFETSTQALYLIIKRELRDVEMLLTSDDIPCDIHLPVALPKLAVANSHGADNRVFKSAA